MHPLRPNSLPSAAPTRNSIFPLRLSLKTVASPRDRVAIGATGKAATGQRTKTSKTSICLLSSISSEIPEEEKRAGSSPCTMGMQWALAVHDIITILVVVSFLCSHWPIFQGTFVQPIHYLITFGAYDFFLRFVAIVFGPIFRYFFLTIEYYCCDRPDPVL